MRLPGLFAAFASACMAASTAQAQQVGGNSAQIELRIVVLPSCGTPDRAGATPTCNFSAERRQPLVETRQETKSTGGGGPDAIVTVITYTP